MVAETVAAPQALTGQAAEGSLQEGVVPLAVLTETAAAAMLAQGAAMEELQPEEEEDASAMEAEDARAAAPGLEIAAVLGAAQKVKAAEAQTAECVVESEAWAGRGDRGARVVADADVPAD